MTTKVSQSRKIRQRALENLKLKKNEKTMASKDQTDRNIGYRT